MIAPLWERKAAVLQPMTKGRRCFVCNKGPIRGEMIVRSGKAKKEGGVGRKITGKTRRTFKPNLQRVRAIVEGQVRRIKVCTSCLRAGKVVKPA
jgi:large subunit ribosomal protein L28